METGRENSSTRRPGARPRLFISYRRRSDTPYARLLKDELTRAFGEGAVFRDVDDIRPGEAFPETIREAVESCDVFLLLVSPGWVELIGELRDPDDFVRREIAAALARQVPVIPVLLGDARMPEPDELPDELRELASRQAIELSDTRWDYDVRRLVEVIAPRAAPPRPDDEEAAHDAAPRSLLGTWPRRLALAAALLLGVSAAVYVYRTRTVTPPDPAAAYEKCLREKVRPPDAVAATVSAQPDDGKARSEVIVGVDEYRVFTTLGGPSIVFRLTDSGRDIGAIQFRYLRNELFKGVVVFKVAVVVEPPCEVVEDHFNHDGKAKSEVYNWDRLTVRLGGRVYRLRIGDHGDSILATLTRASGE